VAQTKALLFEKNSILFYNNFYNLLFASGWQWFAPVRRVRIILWYHGYVWWFFFLEPLSMPFIWDVLLGLYGLWFSNKVSSSESMSVSLIILEFINLSKRHDINIIDNFLKHQFTCISLQG
jgi:hypothetical protein